MQGCPRRPTAAVLGSRPYRALDTLRHIQHHPAPRIVVLGEPITWRLALGAVLIVGGVLVIATG